MSNLKYYAIYNVYRKFVVPPEYRLDDKSVVKDHWVRWDNLHIELVSGEKIIICGELEESDFKYPLNQDDFADDPDLTDTEPDM